jgi:hypothetical protein
MAYRSTKAVNLSVDPELHEFAKALVELNKKQNIQPVSVSAMFEIGIVEVGREAIARCRKAKIKIPSTIAKH